jgi:hypothetical protein
MGRVAIDRVQPGDPVPYAEPSGLVRGRHDRRMTCRACTRKFKGLPEDLFCERCAPLHLALARVRQNIPEWIDAKRAAAVVRDGLARGSKKAIADLEHDIEDAIAVTFRASVLAARATRSAKADIARVIREELAGKTTKNKPARIGDRYFDYKYGDYDRPCLVCKKRKRTFDGPLCGLCDLRGKALVEVRTWVSRRFHLGPLSTPPSTKVIDQLNSEVEALLVKAMPRDPTSAFDKARRTLESFELSLSLAEAKVAGATTKRIREVVEYELTRRSGEDG